MFLGSWLHHDLRFSSLSFLPPSFKDPRDFIIGLIFKGKCSQMLVKAGETDFIQ